MNHAVKNIRAVTFFIGAIVCTKDFDWITNMIVPGTIVCSNNSYLIKNSQAVKKGVRPLKRLW